MDRKEIKKLIEEAGGVERISQGIQKAESNRIWLDDNHERLLGKYPNKWIGVQDWEVVAVSRTLDGLVRIMRKKGIEMGTAKIEFLDLHPKPQILTNLALAY